MPIQYFVEQPGIAIGYDAANDWLYADWRGEHDQETSRAGCMLLLETLHQHPCRKLLNDNSNVTRQTMQLTPWVAWWIGEMARGGMQYIAWVYPREFENRRDTEQNVKFVQQPVIASFDDLASAYGWLQQQ